MDGVVHVADRVQVAWSDGEGGPGRLGGAIVGRGRGNPDRLEDPCLANATRELLWDARRTAGRVHDHPVRDRVCRDNPVRPDERRPAADDHPAEPDDLGRDRQLGARRDRDEEGELHRADEPGEAARGVPLPAETEPLGVNPRSVLRVREQDRGAGAPPGRRLVEPDAVRDRDPAG